MKLLLAAATLLALTATANAEVICTQHRGCFETGLKILRNGGAYTGLGYKYLRDAPHPKAKFGQGVQVRRETW
jgi:hypothetical protein